MKEWIIEDDFLDEDIKRAASAQGYLHELIRCKDCKWCRTFYHGETMPFSYECAKLWLTGIGVDDFCSKAERKEE